VSRRDKEATRMSQASETPILFTRGNPAAEGLPLAEILECAETAFRRDGAVVFQYGHYSGYTPLREWIAARYEVAPEQILLCNGSMELFTFIGSLLVRPGDTVYVESPSYDRAVTALRRAGANVVGIPLEPDGVNLNRLEAALQTSKPALFYLIADFQNPSGVTTSLAKRREIARQAAAHGFWVVEDAPYRALRYRGSDVPTLREITPERTLHISSFSKTLSPGMRIGYAVLPAELAPRFRKWSEDTYIHPVLPTEGIVNEYCRRGLLERNIARLKALYSPRMEAILTALHNHLTGATWIEPEGGFFVSATLPADVDGRAVWADAKRFGLVLTDGRGFFPDGTGANFVRLPFCALTPEEIAEGVRRLAQAMAAHKKG
jgi:2-aminoadipate transaminase